VSELLFTARGVENRISLKKSRTGKTPANKGSDENKEKNNNEFLFRVVTAGSGEQ